MPLNPVELVGGLAIGEGVGGAIADVVIPQLQDLKNTQWSKHTLVPLPGELGARLIAESVPFSNFNPGQDATFAGINGDRFQAMIELARRYPGLPEALMMWRRGFANYGNVSGWLHRAGLSDEIVQQMIGPGPDPARLFYDRLDPAQIALGIVRSLLADPGLMPVQLDTAGGVVPRYPQSSIDPLQEAIDSGIDRERLRVLVGEIGLPMSTQQAASAFFRGIIERPDYNRSILEGDVRPEWADAILAQARQILTAGEYAELQLRGYYDRAQRLLNTAKHGMSVADSDLLYNVLGRSVNVHAVTTGLARGGTYPSTYADVPQPYRAAIQRSNIREEWVGLAYANRYTYPSAFVLRALAQAGDLGDEAAVEQILLEIGWKPDLAKQVAARWVPAGASADPHVAKAQTQLWNTIHRSYLNGESDQAKVETNLNAAGVALDAIPQIVAIWNVERDFIRKQLTPKQLRDAVAGQVLNLTTGAAWTLDEAIAELIGRGYSLADASTFMAE
jgi:hypothetical protein